MASKALSLCARSIAVGARVCEALPRLASSVPIRLQSSYGSRGSGGSSSNRQFRGMYFAKPTGCVNMRVVQPRFKATGPTGVFHHLSKQGSVALEVAPVLPVEGGQQGGRTGFDWASKLTYSLSATDITYLASVGMNQEVHLKQTIYAQNASTVRTMTIAPDGTKDRAHFRLSISQRQEGGEDRSVDVWLSQHDLTLLKYLANQSLSTITGWAINLDPGLYDPALHADTSRTAAGGAGAGGEGGDDGGVQH